MIENEVKFVLRDTPLDLQDWTCSNIWQHYLPNDIRIRQEELVCTINHKTLLDSGEYEELEYPISEEVYRLLEAKQSLRGLFKFRYAYLNKETDELWSIDYLLKDGETYFVVAECEMPSGRNFPISLPQPISESLICAVPRAHTWKYSNFKLCDVAYALSLMETLTRGS